MQTTANKRRLLLILLTLLGAAAAIFIAGCGLADSESAIDSSSTSASKEHDSAQSQLKSETIYAQEKTVETKLDENKEAFFNITIDDFINRYNRHCQQDKKSSALPPSGEWSSYVSDSGIHSDHAVLNYVFVHENDPDFYPTLHVYLAENNARLQEIAISYDDHDYREVTYRTFRLMCFYSLKSLYPEQTDQKISSLLQMMDQEGAFSEQKYAQDAVPCILYHHDGLGVYLYRHRGSSMYFCVIPVTADILRDFQSKGAELCEAF